MSDPVTDDDDDGLTDFRDLTDFNELTAVHEAPDAVPSLRDERQMSHVETRLPSVCGSTPAPLEDRTKRGMDACSGCEIGLRSRARGWPEGWGA